MSVLPGVSPEIAARDAAEIAHSEELPVQADRADGERAVI
jgi:hypothetical protein